MSRPITPRQRDLLKIIYHYIKDSGYPPTFEDMRTRLGVKSNQSVIDLLAALEKKGLLKKDQSGARTLAILPLGYDILKTEPLAPFLGITHAGSPITTTEIAGEWHRLSKDVSRLIDEVFVLRVSGDSMINAGISDGDSVLVKVQKEFISGDIVLAEVDGESTIKRFISQDKPPYLFLKPENPNYKPIYFTTQVQMTGKVVSLLKSGQWQPVN